MTFLKYLIMKKVNYVLTLTEKHILNAISLGRQVSTTKLTSLQKGRQNLHRLEITFRIIEVLPNIHSPMRQMNQLFFQCPCQGSLLETN